MEKITWDIYYGYYDRWIDSTRKRLAEELTDYGPPEEVVEVVRVLAENDKKFAAKFMNRALDANVRFTPEQTLDLMVSVDGPTLGRMAETAEPPFTRRQLEKIDWLIDEETVKRIAKKAGIGYIEDNCLEWSYQNDAAASPSANVVFVQQQVPEEKPPKLGFFENLGLFVLAGGIVNALFGDKHDRW